MRPNGLVPAPRIPLRRVPKTVSRHAGKREAGSGRGAVFREVRNGARSVPPTAIGEALPVKAKNTHRRACVVLSGFGAALAGTPVLAVLGAGSDAVALTWIAAVGWTVVASFVQALVDGIRRGDWSAFACGEIPRNDEDLDFSMKSGRYAHLRIRATHEALMRESDRFPENPDRTGVQP